MPINPQTELTQVEQRILGSTAHKRIIVAGPGAGKTTAFRKIIEACKSQKERMLVFTFIANLKAELERDLGHLAPVFTFHGYCHHLLRKRSDLRIGLTDEFYYFPPLPSLIKTDWELIKQNEAPHFVKAMRRLEDGSEADFYMQRSDYYDTVAFDDSVFRVYRQLSSDPSKVTEYDLILVDEYQDFNRLESVCIELLASKNRIVIAGDDDQALYSLLRESSPEFIRQLYGGGEYECHQLPFCMRCTQVIVESIDDIIKNAVHIGALGLRIPKRYLFFPPRKAEDSKRYPKIKLVEISAQNKQSNYYGRYVEQQIRLIPPQEIAESRQGHFPTVLIVGPRQYLKQITSYLETRGYLCDKKVSDESAKLNRSDVLRILKKQPGANLGWRAIIDIDKPEYWGEVIRKSFQDGKPLVENLVPTYRDQILTEAQSLQEESSEITSATAEDEAKPSIKLTSFEGSKGLSAQHVFIVGLQEGELPKNAQKINDLEICKLIVALTRTRKQCHLLYTWRWSGTVKRPSVFLTWIASRRFQRIKVDKNYW